jgi:hypothetical protein
MYGRGFVQRRRWLSSEAADAVEEVPVFKLGFIRERQGCRQVMPLCLKCKEN